MNIIVFVCDTLRVDHLGCYGYFRDTSPNIDRLAEEGVVFERAYASGVATGVSFTSIHTGLYPIRHKVYNLAPPMLILDEVPTIAELLRTNGYTTVAFDNLAHNRMWCRDPVHFYRGFEYYVSDVSNPRDWNDKGEAVPAEWFTTRLVQWLSSHSQDKFFAFVHLWDVHQPYVLPESYRRKFHHQVGDRDDLDIRTAKAGYQYVPGWGQIDQLYEGHGTIPEMRSPQSVPRREASIDLYDASIHYMDHHIGHVIDYLKKEEMLDETLILLTADHGELLGQHGIYSHVSSYEPNIHVPLILRYPARWPQPRRTDALAGTIDLLPTLMDLAGVEDVPTVDGKSLIPATEGEEIRDRIVSEDGSGMRSFIVGDWKLIVYYDDDKMELYHLADDPMETVDLAQEQPDRVAQLRRDLDRWAEEHTASDDEDPILWIGREYGRRELWEKVHIKNYKPQE